MLLKHVSPMHERSFHKSDFTRYGMEGQGAVSFNQDNNHLAEVDDEVATWLLENYSDEFREATEADQKTLDLSRPNAKDHYTSPRAAMTAAESTGASIMDVVGAATDRGVSKSGLGSTTGSTETAGATGGGSTGGGSTGGGSTSGRASRSTR